MNERSSPKGRPGGLQDPEGNEARNNERPGSEGNGGHQNLSPTRNKRRGNDAQEFVCGILLAIQLRAELAFERSKRDQALEDERKPMTEEAESLHESRSSILSQKIRYMEDELRARLAAAIRSATACGQAEEHPRHCLPSKFFELVQAFKLQRETTNQLKAQKNEEWKAIEPKRMEWQAAGLAQALDRYRGMRGKSKPAQALDSGAAPRAYRSFDDAAETWFRSKKLYIRQRDRKSRIASALCRSQIKLSWSRKRRL